MRNDHQQREWTSAASALRRAAAVLLVSASALAPVVAAAAPAAAPSPIRSAAEDAYPPFSLLIDGRATGFSVELLRASAAAMGRRVSFRTGTWTDVRGLLERGEIEALPLVGRTPEREPLFDFTVPYMTLYGAIVVREDETGITSLEDLRGLEVAVMAGDNAEEFLRREPRGIAIRTTESYETALRELAAGRHDAVVMQRLVALRLLSGLALDGLRVVNRPIEAFRQDFCFAVREGDRETLAVLNEGLALVIADGTYRRLHAEWFAALELPTHRRIVVGGDRALPPFEYLDASGRPAGFNVDLTRAIARATGLDVEIRLGPWAEVRGALERGEVDALQGMFSSPEREAAVDFTPPHTAVHSVAVVRKGDSPPATVAECAGRRLAVQRGDIMHDALREAGLAGDALLLETQEDALRAVLDGHADAALVARVTALYFIDEHGWDGLQVGREALISPEYCYAVPNGHKALLAQLSEGLRVLEESGEYHEIYDRWMGVYQPRTLTLSDALRRSALVLGPLLLGLLAVFLWLWLLRRQVASRTAELRAVESELAQSQRIESVGRLAGGVAHDFNNVLTVIIANAELAATRLPAEHPARAELDQILIAARHSTEITRQLLGFARRQAIAPRRLDLDQTVERLLTMLRRLIGEHVELVWRPGAVSANVLIDPVQVDQILTNLCVNARDAIDTTGSVTIRTATVTLDEEFCRSHPGADPGEYVMLQVTDDGSGMDEATRARAFDPFFTTKGVGEGTGLGLATVYGIVKQNRGFVDVESEVGRGSTFTVYLPRLTGQADVEAPSAPSPSLQTSAGSDRTILLVEDDPGILDALSQVLEGQGYCVLAASRPHQAVELARTHPGRLDLLITDVVMPEMDGKALATTLHDDRPDLEVLFMSGYTADVIAQHGVLDPGLHFLQKPFPMKSLTTKIREILGDDGAAAWHPPTSTGTTPASTG